MQMPQKAVVGTLNQWPSLHSMYLQIPGQTMQEDNKADLLLARHAYLEIGTL